VKLRVCHISSHGLDQGFSLSDWFGLHQPEETLVSVDGQVKAAKIFGEL